MTERYTRITAEQYTRAAKPGETATVTFPSCTTAAPPVALAARIGPAVDGEAIWISLVPWMPEKDGQ